VHTAPYNNIGSRYGGTLKQQKNYNCTIAAICIHLTNEEFHLRQDEVTKPSCTINIVRMYCSNQDLQGKKQICLMAWRLNNGSKMIIDAQLTGNWTYFVGNFDGRLVHEYDFSTYSQNSIWQHWQNISYMQGVNINKNTFWSSFLTFHWPDFYGIIHATACKACDITRVEILQRNNIFDQYL